MKNNYTTHACHSKGFRSGLELRVSNELNCLNVNFQYETLKIKYFKPKTLHIYTPDFILESGVIVETKGFFSPVDRKKHLLIKLQYPNLDIRFVFDNSSNKINKGSKTTYAKWCEKNGFLYSDKLIPIEWTKK